MLKYATVKISSTCNTSHKKLYMAYKRSLCNKISYLNKCTPKYIAKNFDCDYTVKIDNCTHTFVTVENTPLYLTICNNDKTNACRLIVK